MTTTTYETAEHSVNLRPLKDLSLRLFYPLIGLSGLIGVWWFGGYLIESNPDLMAFSDFAPLPTFYALLDLINSGDLWSTISSSLYRILTGLIWGIVIGLPTGILIGYIDVAMKTANVPFQFIRMISPLAWMPIAVWLLTVGILQSFF